MNNWECCCDYGIFTKYILKQLMDMKYYYEVQAFLAFFETHRINLELFLICANGQPTRHGFLCVQIIVNRLHQCFV
jgi:hypothetical protein